MHGGIECRVRAYEQQFEPFIGKLDAGLRQFDGCVRGGQQSWQRGGTYAPASHLIGQAATRDAQQPRFGFFWNAAARPVLQRGEEGLGERVLDRCHVARTYGKEGDQPLPRIARGPLDGVVYIELGRHPSSGRLGRTSTTWPDRCGKRAAHSSAASRCGTSMMKNPPSCSFTSANGPSCTRR